MEPTEIPTALDIGLAANRAQVEYSAEVPYTCLSYGNYGFYRGPSGTFPAYMQPMAVYDAVSNRTFFAWTNGYSPASVVVGYYDHAARKVGGVLRIIDLPDGDGHRNPTIHLDAAGHLLVFANGKNSATWIKKTVRPRDISEWAWSASIPGENTYSQPHELVPGQLTVFTRIGPSWGWAYRRSLNAGASWGAAVTVVAPANPAVDSVYALTASRAGTVHMAWTVLDGSVQKRQNIWYARSAGGVAWARSDGTALSLPIEARTGAELVFDSGSDQVNTQDLRIDSNGEPLILVSHGSVPGAWSWKLLKRKAGVWQAFDIGAIGDRQFDCGGLILDSDTRLRALLPTGLGAVAGEDGGNIEEWLSEDGGESWVPNRTLTGDRLNHNHVKVVAGGQPGFRAFWSYGDPRTAGPAVLKFLDEERGVETIRPGDPFARKIVVSGNGQTPSLQALNAPIGLRVDVSDASVRWRGGEPGN